MEANETPDALQHDFFGSHVGDRVNKADRIEGEFDQMTFGSLRVKVVTNEALPVLNLFLIDLQHQRVGGLNMIVNQVSWQNSTLSLREIKAWELFLHSLWVSLRIVNVENTSGKS